MISVPLVLNVVLVSNLRNTRKTKEMVKIGVPPYEHTCMMKTLTLIWVLAVLASRITDIIKKEIDQDPLHLDTKRKNFGRVPQVGIE